jgi:hypothetical protein
MSTATAEANFAALAIENLTFGIEIETAGQDTAHTAAIVAGALPGATVQRNGGYYCTQTVVMADGRKWTVVTDGSIHGIGAEVVSPILRGTADIEMVQTIARALRAAGLRSSADDGCGIHVHVGIGQFTPVQVAQITRVAAKSDKLLRGCAKPSASRTRWCPTPPTAMVRRMGNATTWAEVASAWYGPRVDVRYARSEHYHQSRYCGINLHSFFYGGRDSYGPVAPGRGTIEFRYFDGTLHAGKIRAYITLCLAVVAKGLSAAPTWRGAALTDLDAGTTTQADVDTLLRSAFGLTGPTHAVVRQHIVAAWTANAESTPTSAVA